MQPTIRRIALLAFLLLLTASVAGAGESGISKSYSDKKLQEYAESVYGDASHMGAPDGREPVMRMDGHKIWYECLPCPEREWVGEIGQHGGVSGYYKWVSYEYKIIPEAELEKWLNEGWDFIAIYSTELKRQEAWRSYTADYNYVNKAIIKRRVK